MNGRTFSDSTFYLAFCANEALKNIDVSVIGANDHWGKYKWIVPIVLGFMHIMCGYATFSVANTMASGNINMPEFKLAFPAAIISFVGLAIDVGIDCFKKRKKV